MYDIMYLFVCVAERLQCALMYISIHPCLKYHMALACMALYIHIYIYIYIYIYMALYIVICVLTWKGMYAHR